MKKNFLLITLLITPLILLSGCNDDDDTSDGGNANNNTYEGAIYAMTNDDTQNSVVAYGRNADGSLTMIGKTASMGTGTGPMNVASGPGANTIDPLASNYSLIMSEDNTLVFAVNAGSDQISSFSVNDDYSLSHVSTVNSGGSDPISLATTGNVVYVANSNQGVGTLNGFTFDKAGNLSPIQSSSRTLTGRPTGIRFTRSGQHMIATEIDTQRLQVFALGNDGNISAMPVTYEYDLPAAGRNFPNPFGIDTIARGDKQFVVIAEARVFTNEAAPAPNPQTSSISTFEVGKDGQLTLASLDIRADSDGDDSTGPITSCWVIADQDSNHLYTGNTNSNNISSFSVSGKGDSELIASLAHQESGEFTASGITDQVVVDGNLYQLYAAAGSVVSFMDNNGVLTEIDRDSDLNAIGGNQGITGF